MNEGYMDKVKALREAGGVDHEALSKQEALLDRADQYELPARGLLTTVVAMCILSAGWFGAGTFSVGQDGSVTFAWSSEVVKVSVGLLGAAIAWWGWGSALSSTARGLKARAGGLKYWIGLGERNTALVDELNEMEEENGRLKEQNGRLVNEVSVLRGHNTAWQDQKPCCEMPQPEPKRKKSTPMPF